MCLLQHTGLKTQNIPMGYICEYEEPECIPKENANLDVYDYKIVMPDSPETVNFEEARTECQKYGKGTGCILSIILTVVSYFELNLFEFDFQALSTESSTLKRLGLNLFQQSDRI